MTIQIVGTYDGGYVVAKDADPPASIASDEQLLVYLKTHGVSEWDATACIQRLRTSPKREIRVTVPGR